jgi:hypothetical protein
MDYHGSKTEEKASRFASIPSSKTIEWTRATRPWSTHEPALWTLKCGKLIDAWLAKRSRGCRVKLPYTVRTTPLT